MEDECEGVGEALGLDDATGLNLREAVLLILAAEELRALLKGSNFRPDPATNLSVLNAEAGFVFEVLEPAAEAEAGTALLEPLGLATRDAAELEETAASVLDIVRGTGTSLLEEADAKAEGVLEGWKDAATNEAFIADELEIRGVAIASVSAAAVPGEGTRTTGMAAGAALEDPEVATEFVATDDKSVGCIIYIQFIKLIYSNYITETINYQLNLNPNIHHNSLVLNNIHLDWRDF